MKRIKKIKNTQLEHSKESKGITLIALVVTIIVLIILAGISISALTGSNGIIDQANNAKDDTQYARLGRENWCCNNKCRR